jgi:hypothetical protein
VRLLLARGARADRADKDGTTPAMLAAAAHPAVAALLNEWQERSDADLRARDAAVPAATPPADWDETGTRRERRPSAATVDSSESTGRKRLAVKRSVDRFLRRDGGGVTCGRDGRRE